MEFFRSLLRSIGLYEPTKVDIVAELPMEVSQLILRKLDPETILNVVQVSRKWKETCQSDPILRRQAREYLKKEEETTDSRGHVPSVRLERKRVPVTRPLHLENRHSRFVGLDARKAFGNVVRGPSAVNHITRTRSRTKTSKRSGGSRAKGFRI